MKLLRNLAIAAATVTALSSSLVQADQLDTVIKRGTLNCGVVLDFPPMGYFDSNNQPAGFDVDYCNDLAEVMGVKSNRDQPNLGRPYSIFDFR